MWMTEESTMVKGVADVAPSLTVLGTRNKMILRIFPVVFLDVELLRLQKPQKCIEYKMHSVIYNTTCIVWDY